MQLITYTNLLGKIKTLFGCSDVADHLVYEAHTKVLLEELMQHLVAEEESRVDSVCSLRSSALYLHLRLELNVPEFEGLVPGHLRMNNNTTNLRFWNAGRTHNLSSVIMSCTIDIKRFNILLRYMQSGSLLVETDEMGFQKTPFR